MYTCTLCDVYYMEASIAKGYIGICEDFAGMTLLPVETFNYITSTS